MDAPASAVEKNADETQSSASPTPTPTPTPPPAADTPPTPTTPPADVAANTDKVSNDAQRSEEANESNHESDSDANDAQDNHSAAPTPTKVEVSVVGENANDMKKETQDEEQDAVDTKDEKKEDMDTKKEKEEEPSDKREEEEQEEQVPPSTPDSPTTESPVVSPPLAESAEASPTSSPTKSDPASSQQAPHFGGFPAPATAVSPGHAQAHTMQFPYASSNFVAPLPTPIRPLPGDPRLANTDGNNNSLSSPTPSLPSAPAQATVNANARMYPPQAQGFYDNNNGVNNNSNNVPVATTNGQMQSDPTSDFERQWNQSVPVPGEMGWAIAPQQPQSSDMASVDVPSQAMAQQQPNNPAAQRDPELTTTPFAAKALVPQRINDTFALEPTALSQLINYGKSLSTPGHAAAFAIDLLRASVDDESSLKAHGWHSPFQSNEYEVLLQKGSIGLCMNMSVRAGCVSVTSFRRPEGGVIGPAEASGIIQIGDDLVGVDGFPIETPEDFQNVVGRLKSLRPVLLRFRRASNVPIHSTRPDTQGYRRGLRTSIASLDNSELFTSGMWHMGVRYLAPGKWAAELHVDGGGIRRLGILPSEREAAMVYNSYIHQTYGPTAAQFMNPAGTGMGPSAAAQQGGMGLPVSMSNVRDMKPIQRPPIRRSSAKAAFTNEQKDQLRAQIMVFKYVSTGTPIEKNWLLRAVKSAAAIPMQEGADKKKRKTFAPQAVTKPLKKKAKRGAKGKKGKKKQFSDESEEESGSDDNFAAPVKEVAPTRRSGRNAGKTQKSYVQKENDSDLEYSDEEKPAAPQEPVGPKGPQIDKIIGIRFHKETADDDDVTMQFLIKWKDVSYLHLSWLTTHDIEEFGHASIMRMRRYLQKNSRDVETARENVVVGDERDFSAYFSESFLEVDRILASKDVEEPEQANPFNNHGVGDDEKPPVKQGKKYLVKWRDLSYVDCTWEWEEEITDDRKIAAFHRHNHPPIVNGAHPAMFEDIRPEPSSWAKYQESPSYNNQNVLRSYQLEGLNWLVFCWYNRRNCILADEMGLGKTVQATSILEHLRQHEHIRGPFLVIAPLATLGNWKREIETWTTMNCVVYHDSEGGADIRSFIREHEFYYPNEMYKKRGIYKFNVLVTSYQTLMADAEFLDVIPWRYVVIDEAHKLKNREAKLLQCLQNFSWDSCLLMTGTPLQNGVYELWCLLNFIEPDKFTSQQEFYDEYGELNTAEQVARLHEQLRPYMLRRVKEDVEKSIPPKEETIIDVELTTMQKKYYRAIFERNRSFLNQGSTGTVANLVNVEMELRKCCNHPFLIRGVEEKECGRGDDAHRAKTLVQASGKTVLLDKLLTKFRAENKKVLIFSQFKIMLDIIEDLCQMRNYNIERMDGSVRGNSRQAAIDRFNNLESDTFAFLLSTRAGGVGINLIAASVVILFDSDWNPQNDLQAVARCHRIGQTQSVNIYRLVTKKTYEAQMFDIASKKLGMHHAVFETGGVRNEFDGEDDGGNMMSLMSLDREKVEMMIRYGAYAIMGGDNEEEDPENRAINEVDIDQLLSSSRTIRYDPTRDNAEGTEVGEDGEPKQPTVSQSSALSFSKASFTAESSDATIDFNDEQFWEKVLGPKTVQVLMTKVQEGWLSKASKDDIKTFLTELRELARAVVQERQRGGAMEDADQVMSILIELKVTGPILKGVVNVRNVASEWQDLIERPKRRRNQDAESELMYLEFLDGTKKAPTPTNGKKKKKGAAATSNRRKSKSKQSFDSEDEVDDDDEDDEPSTPVRKPKRAKRQPSTGSAASTSSAKSGVHIVVRKKEDGDDEEYEVVRTYSTVKKTHALMFPDEAGAATPGKTALTTPKRRGRPPKKIVEEEPDDDDDDEDAEKDDDAESGGEGEDAPSEEEAEDEEEDDDDEADDDDEDEDEDTPKKSRGRRAAAKKKPAPKPRGKKGTSARKRAASVDPQVDEEMWCRVCFSDQGFMDDPIVQCERCHVAVHKYCYGIDKVPEGDTPWFCDYCGDTQQSAADATCALCPLKRSSAAFKKTRENDWVHVVCALWAPGVQFSDVERMKEVINVPEAITETRGEHCGICKEKDGCIKCFRGSCLMYFHPLCGRESKGDFDMFMNEGGQLRAFCPKHKSRSKRA